MREPLVPASFLARPNRFIVRASLRGGRKIEAHLADPGRLRELLVPGAELRLRPTRAGGGRRTRFRVALVRAAAPRSVWVSVETAQANRLAEILLRAGTIRGVGRGGRLRREVSREGSRFDFLLDRPDEPSLWVEVKSVTLVENGVARFPDAPTSRGRRHLLELTRIVRDGGGAMVLFVAQREDVRSIAPHRIIDPGFSAALDVARRAGVLLRGARFRLDAAGRATFRGMVRVRS